MLVVRVHKDILEREAIPDPPRRDKKIWRERYRSIDDFVRHLGVNGTRVVKIFLHRSKDEQRKRSLDRIDNAEKNWKFSNADLKEREFWDDYARAYAECLGETSTSDTPRCVAPADDKENARLIVSQILVDTLEALDISYPKTSAGREVELPAFRKALVRKSGEEAPSSKNITKSLVIFDLDGALAASKRTSTPK